MSEDEQGRGKVGSPRSDGGRHSFSPPGRRIDLLGISLRIQPTETVIVRPAAPQTEPPAAGGPRVVTWRNEDQKIVQS